MIRPLRGHGAAVTGVAFNADAAGLGECGDRALFSFQSGAVRSLLPPSPPPSSTEPPGSSGRGGGAGSRAGRAGRGVSAPSLSDKF